MTGRLSGASKSTLYGSEMGELVGRKHDALGEVVWDRDKVLRVCGGHANEGGGRHARPNRDG